jgi:hypothetical protein
MSRLGRALRAPEVALLRAVTPEEAEAMSDAFLERRRALAGAVDRYLEETEVRLDVGDDGFGDLIAHVIGMGRDAYEQALAEPAQVVERGQSGDFEESFAYAIPDRDSYAKLLPGRYAERARKLRRDYAEAAERAVDLKNADAIAEAVTRLVALLRPMAEGDWKAFLATESEGVALAESIVALAAPLFRYAAFRAGGDTLSSPWPVRNLYSDVALWLRDFPQGDV